jgi:hypothetical protein
MPSLSAAFPWFRRSKRPSGSPAASMPRTDTAQPGAAARERVRQAHNVRLVTEQEEGHAVHRLPPGVYGFTYAPGLEDAPLFRKQTYGSFELHILADGTPAIVGFASAEHAAGLEAGREFELVLFPDPRDEAPVIVTVPYGRIAVYREISQHTARQGGLRIRVGPGAAP